MRRLAVAAMAAVTALALMSTLPVLAATLTGNINPPCSLEARSYDAAGSPLDEGVIENGSSPEGTQANPFRVDWDGHVDFRFQTGTTVFQNNNWTIYADTLTGPLPVAILSGSDDNPLDLDEIGAVDIHEVTQGLPKFVGLVHITGNLVGNGNSSRCDGDGWVQIIGDPIGTVAWDAMVLLILAGAIFLVATPYTVTWEEGSLTPWEGHMAGPRPEN
jgi:hypothetical protein